MRAWSIAFCLLLATSICVFGRGEIFRVQLDDSINPISRDLIRRTLREADSAEAGLVLIELDTPGGLDASTRDIVAALFASDTPVVVYVSPSGARAASAGTFITMAADIAAMAPGTNIGAAHPVSLTGGSNGGDTEASTSMEKAANDAAAFARSIAERRNRNIAWAESAVLDSSSISASEAMALGVIDLIAEDVASLLAAIDGRRVRNVVLRTAASPQRLIRPNLRERVLSLLANPNLVYVLFILGLYGLIYEFFQPGIGFGLAAGGVCLLLALFGMQVLPVSITGLLLVVFGMGLMVLDAFTPTNGILTAGGIIALLIGSLTLFDLPDRSIGISLGTLVAVIGISTAFSVFVLSKGLMIQRKAAATGSSQLIGAIGVVRRELCPDGTIAIRGEYWNAHSVEGEIPEGARVRVIASERRTLIVKRIHA